MKIGRGVSTVVVAATCAGLASSVAGCSAPPAPCTAAGQAHLSAWADRIATPAHARIAWVERPYCSTASTVAFDTLSMHFQTQPHSRAAVRTAFRRQLADHQWHRVRSSVPTFTRREGGVTLWARLPWGHHWVEIDLGDGTG